MRGGAQEPGRTSKVGGVLSEASCRAPCLQPRPLLPAFVSFSCALWVGLRSLLGALGEPCGMHGAQKRRAVPPRTGRPEGGGSTCVLPSLHEVVEIRGAESCPFEALGRQDFTNGNSALVLQTVSPDVRMSVTTGFLLPAGQPTPPCVDSEHRSCLRQ